MSIKNLFKLKFNTKFDKPLEIKKKKKHFTKHPLTEHHKTRKTATSSHKPSHKKKIRTEPKIIENKLNFLKVISVLPPNAQIFFFFFVCLYTLLYLSIPFRSINFHVSVSTHI